MWGRTRACVSARQAFSTRSSGTSEAQGSNCQATRHRIRLAGSVSILASKRTTSLRLRRLLSLKRGRLATWCPNLGLGLPLLAESQMGVLHPLNLAVFRLLPPRRGDALLIVVQTFLAGLFAYAFARQVGAGTAGGLRRATDLVVNGIEPASGVIAVRFRNRHAGEAIVQAIEVGPGSGGEGAKPVLFDLPWEPELVNAGFEDGVKGATGSNGSTAGGFGWHYVFAGKKRSYVWGETGFKIHPQWGLPKPRTGKEALRTHTDGDGHNIVYQEVDVKPRTAYRASVWVRAADLHGKGFGTRPGDSAGLCIEELDRSGKVLVKHPKVAITKARDYTELVKTFTAHDQTARVRFILDTVIGARYDQGHVAYDDCVLERQKKAPGDRRP